MALPKVNLLISVPLKLQIKCEPYIENEVGAPRIVGEAASIMQEPNERKNAGSETKNMCKGCNGRGSMPETWPVHSVHVRIELNCCA